MNKICRKIQKKLMFITLTLLVILTMGCESESPEADNEYGVYCLNKEETKIFEVPYYTDNETVEALCEELLDQLSTTPAKLEYEAPIKDYSVLNYQIDNETLIINFDKAYKNQSTIREILSRAAIVRTMTSVSGIEHVSFLIENDALIDDAGNAIGIMAADNFIDNAGDEINTYEKTTLLLYFANSDGDMLLPIKRSVVYNSNIPVEKLVVEQIISGPGQGIEAMPVVDSTTKILSVHTQDGICYVNLDSAFKNVSSEATAQATVYAIVNSLTELPSINKVQLSIEGESAVLFREQIDMSAPLERNLEIIGK